MKNDFFKNLKADIISTNDNCMILVLGRTRSGKSYAALKIAHTIDPKFRARNVVHSGSKFTQLLNSGKLKKGDVVILDEAGAAIPASQWWGVINQAMNLVLQTYGSMNLIVIFTTPFAKLMDAKARAFPNLILELQKKNKWLLKKGYTRAKIKRIEIDPFTHKVYRKYPREKTSDGIKIYRTIRISKPPKWLIDEYEKKTEPFKQKIRKNAEFNIKIAESVKSKMTIGQIKDYILSNKDKFIKTNKKRSYIDAELVVGELNCTVVAARSAKKLVEQDLFRKNANKKTKR